MPTVDFFRREKTFEFKLHPAKKVSLEKTAQDREKYTTDGLTQAQSHVEFPDVYYGSVSDALRGKGGAPKEQF